MNKWTSRVPILADYLDDGAQPRSDAEPTSAWLVGIIAAVGGSVTAGTALLNGLMPEPIQAVAIRAIIPLILAVMTRVAITSKRTSFERETRTEVTRYAYGARTRLVSKIALPIFLALMGWRLLYLIPNVGPGKRIRGYICRSNGDAVTDGSIDVADVRGRSVAKRREQLDTNGFFVVDVESWTLPPATIRVQSPECKEEGVAGYEDYAPRVDSCKDSTADTREKGEFKSWAIKCEAP